MSRGTPRTRQRWVSIAHRSQVINYLYPYLYNFYIFAPPGLCHSSKATNTSDCTDVILFPTERL
jgi:hypothetical protein